MGSQGPFLSGLSDNPPQVNVDSSALAEFVQVAEKYRSQLLWVAKRIANNREDAEDILQLALMKAYRGLSHFRGDSRMRTWLSAIVLNTAREFSRNQRGRETLSLESFLPDEYISRLAFMDRSPNPEEQFERLERKELLAQAMCSLSEHDRRVLKMCVLDQLPYMCVATVLNVKVSTLKSQVFRGKRRLRWTICNRAGQLRGRIDSAEITREVIDAASVVPTSEPQINLRDAASASL